MSSNLRLLMAATLVIFVPGCSSGKAFRPGDTDFPVELGLAPGQTISIHNPLDSLVVSAVGESLVVTFSWSKGDPVLRMNGMQFRPAVPEPAAPPPDSAWLARWLAVPFISERAGENPSYVQLLAAYNAYNDACTDISRNIRRKYAGMVPTSPTNGAEQAIANEAAQACCELTSGSDLVDSCEVFVGELMLHIRGTNDKMSVFLDSGDQWTDVPPPPPTSVSQEQALTHVQNIVIALRTWNPCDIELGRGRFEVTGRRIPETPGGGGAR